jgi:hypothetical protein
MIAITAHRAPSIALPARFRDDGAAQKVIQTPLGN